MSRRATMPAAIAALALAAMAAGCGSSSHSTGAPPVTTAGSRATTAGSSATTAVASTPPPASAATVPATTVPPSTIPGPTTVPAPPACVSGQITVSLGPGGAGLGHIGLPLLFHNSGGARCLLQGYPGVALLDAAGAQVAQAVRTPSGYLGGLTPGATTWPAVPVGPGATVSALLEGTDNPTGTATTCPYYPALLVTPPNQTVAVRLELAKGAPGPTNGFPGCSDPEIHPIIAGTTGRQG